MQDLRRVMGEKVQRWEAAHLAGWSQLYCKKRIRSSKGERMPLTGRRARWVHTPEKEHNVGKEVWCMMCLGDSPTRLCQLLSIRCRGRPNDEKAQLIFIIVRSRVVGIWTPSNQAEQQDQASTRKRRLCLRRADRRHQRIPCAEERLASWGKKPFGLRNQNAWNHGMVRASNGKRVTRRCETIGRKSRGEEKWLSAACVGRQFRSFSFFVHCFRHLSRSIAW